MGASEVTPPTNYEVFYRQISEGGKCRTHNDGDDDGNDNNNIEKSMDIFQATTMALRKEKFPAVLLQIDPQILRSTNYVIVKHQ